MVKGVIFDMDGTMFDTECLSTKGWIYAGKKLGVDIPIVLTDSFRGRNPTTEEFGSGPFVVGYSGRNMEDLLCGSHACGL